MLRIMRMGPMYSTDAVVLRRWFAGNQERLNVIVRWEGELKARIIDFAPGGA
jgi:hypothetical protein